MKNPLALFHDILFLGLRPWNNRALPEAKFKELVQEEEAPAYNHQPLFKIDFPKPLNSKRKYYKLLAEKGSILFLNYIKQNIDDSINDKERLFFVVQQALKPLAQKLKETNAIIEEHGYHWDIIKGTAHRVRDEANRSDEAYILQLVKYHLMHLYLEIQDSFSYLISDDAYNTEELHDKFFTEGEMQSGIIVEAEKINLPVPASQVKADPHAISFERKAFDFRDPKKGVLPFKEIMRNEQRFLSFEEELFQHNIIDADYNFIDEHGNKQLLAAAVQTAISKKYFNERNFVKREPMKQVEIRKFIDHRYSASIDKQFRLWGNDTNALAQFLDNHFWITNLPTG